MEYPSNQFNYRIKLILIFVMFFAYGYSMPLDTIKKQNCPDGISVQINGNVQCIDSSVRFYPYSPYYQPPKYWIDDSEEDFYNKFVSIDLQIFGESKWYNEDIQEDRLRIFLFRCAPSYDSIVLYSFFKQGSDSFKLIKKEMPVFYPFVCFLPDSNYFLVDSVYYWPAWDYVLPDSSCYYNNNKDTTYIVNYNQIDFIIHNKKIKKLKKHLDALGTCETFDRFAYAIRFVIEYFCKGNYYLLIAHEPCDWCNRDLISREFIKECPKKSGLKIMKWLSKY